MNQVENPYQFLMQHAENTPDGLAVGSLETEITWGQLKHEVDRISAKLRFLGIKKGQIVCLLGENIFLWKLQLALFKLAAVPAIVTTPIVPDYLHNELLIIDRKAKTNAHNVLVADSEWMEDAQSKFKNVPLEASYAPDEPFRLILTSGTTGTPKAVINPFIKFQTRTSPEVISKYEIPELSLMGFSAAIGFWVAIRSLVGGHPYISITGIQNKSADVISKYGIKVLTASPAQLMGEMRSWQSNDPRLTSLEKIVSTGATASYALVKELMTKTDADILTRFGSSEAGLIAERSLKDFDSDEKWIGNLTPGASAKILDDKGNEAPPSEVGHLYVKSSFVAPGYLRNPDETAGRFFDGWFKTGDLALINTEGQIILSARDSELINMGGAKVDPERIDLAIATHPDVLDCGTYAHKRPNGQVLAVSLVKIKSFDKIPQVSNYLNAKFGPLKPKLVLPVDTIPRTANGKLDRNKLAAMYSARVESYLQKVESSSTR